ncbi:MAG: HPP family protein, partial [Dehalococcoidia bacterium]
MRAKEIMSAPVVTLRPDATVGEAVDLMLSHQISCLPVVDDRERLVGILTHTDFGLHQKFLPLADNLYTVLGSWATPKTL